MTRIMAECIPNIVEVQIIVVDHSRDTWYRQYSDNPGEFQDLLPGWQWAPMDTTTELPELPFRPWNSSIPICGQYLPILSSFFYPRCMFI